tara:strand:+ start:1035 stop:1235 length:201 start_codon:yes stop_codon:yes gene_type:complete
MGWFITLIIDESLFMVELFKFLRIGFASMDDESGVARALILGVWKIETNITLALRKKLTWHDVGEA